MSPPTTYRHVPEWLAWRYPAIAALEDNPLYLRLTGQAYCRRGGRSHWTVARAMMALWQSRVLVPLAPIILLIPGISAAKVWTALIICVALVMAPWMRFVSRSFWRAEARTGRLTHLWLCMTPQEIADALVGAWLLPGWRARLVAPAVAAAAGAALATWSYLSPDIGPKAGIAFWAAVILTMAVSAPPKVYSDVARAFGDIRDSLTRGALPPIGLAWPDSRCAPSIVRNLTRGIIAGMEATIFLSVVLTAAIELFPPNTAMAVIALALIGNVIFACWAWREYAEVWRMTLNDPPFSDAIDRAREQAIAAIREHLPRIIERYPATSGM